MEVVRKDGIAILNVAALVCLIFLTVQGKLNAQSPRVSIDMNNFGAAWRAYIAAPGADKASTLIGILPNGQAEVEVDSAVRTLINTDLHILEREMLAGERNSLRLGFRLFSISDEELKNSLIKLVGYMLRYKAKLFLEELQANEFFVPDLELLLTSYKLSHPEDYAQQKLELNIRLKALGYIEEKELKEIKKKCLKILQAQVQ